MNPNLSVNVRFLQNEKAIQKILLKVGFDYPACGFVCSKLYVDGWKVKRAMLAYEGIDMPSLRTLQRLIKKYSQNRLTLRGLQDAYLLRHPRVLLDKVKKKRHIYLVINPKLRWRVLVRDGFCCVACGGVPPEVKLHVDHIVPRTKGGTNRFDNLQTLCSLCNLGKCDILESVK